MPARIQRTKPAVFVAAAILAIAINALRASPELIPQYLQESYRQGIDVNSKYASSPLNISMIVRPGSLLNDKTVYWSETLLRPWLDPSLPSPPAILILTTFGWNKPNQTAGLEIYRGLWTRELLQGIINHP